MAIKEIWMQWKDGIKIFLLGIVMVCLIITMLNLGQLINQDNERNMRQFCANDIVYSGNAFGVGIGLWHNATGIDASVFNSTSFKYPR